MGNGRRDTDAESLGGFHQYRLSRSCVWAFEMHLQQHRLPFDVKCVSTHPETMWVDELRGNRVTSNWRQDNLSRGCCVRPHRHSSVETYSNLVNEVSVSTLLTAGVERGAKSSGVPKLRNALFTMFTNFPTPCADGRNNTILSFWAADGRHRSTKSHDPVGSDVDSVFGAASRFFTVVNCATTKGPSKALTPTTAPSAVFARKLREG